MNILTDPVFRTMHGRKTSMASLSDILAAHASHERVALPALRAHQQHAWHTFLCHLAVLSLETAGLDTMPTRSDRWTAIIQNLTPDQHWPHCWEMFVPDLTKPAFMQPPIGPFGNAGDYKRVYQTPDSADILPSKANHEIKTDTALLNRPDDWIMALISMQTQIGYDGSKNYGIARMKGGLGNRPCVTLLPAGFDESTVARDVHAILRAQHDQPERWSADEHKVKLLWTMPWDGQEEEYVEEQDLHPLFIDSPRRIRIDISDDGSIRALQALSEQRHVLDTDQDGFLADPWCPMNVEKRASHSPSDNGTTWRQVVQFLTEPDVWEPPILMNPTPDELERQQPLQILTRNVTRGLGKTFGYHEHRYDVGPNTVRLMLKRPPDADAVKTASARLRVVTNMTTHLREALQILQHHGSAEPKEYRNKRSRTLATPWTDFFNQQIGELFFQHLEIELAAPQEDRAAIRKKWVADDITPIATRILEQAQNTLLTPARTAQQSRLRARDFLAHRAARVASRAGR